MTELALKHDQSTPKVFNVDIHSALTNYLSVPWLQVKQGKAVMSLVLPSDISEDGEEVAIYDCDPIETVLAFIECNCHYDMRSGLHVISRRKEQEKNILLEKLKEMASIVEGLGISDFDE